MTGAAVRRPGPPLVPAAVLYAGAVAVAGAAVLALTVWRQPPAAGWDPTLLWPCYLLAAVLLAGELRPLLVPRGDGEADRVTVSSTSALALVFCGPLVLVLVVQAVAVLVDDVRRRDPLRAAFNAGHYLLALAAARGVFCLLTQAPLFAPRTLVRPDHLFAAVVSGSVFFAIGSGAAAIAVSLLARRRLLEVLAADLREHGFAALVLLGLAPVTALVTTVAPLMLPLLVLPLVAVHRTASLAARRQHEALHDSLTGLPNRVLFQRVVAAGLTGTEGGRLGVLVLDLDHFRDVNDSLGHQLGDDVLLEVSGRLLAVLPEGAVPARLGGDEFGVLLPGASREDVCDVARRVTARLREPVVIGGVRIGVRGSIGIAVAPEHARDVETLLRRADIAQHRAKHARDDVEVYRDEIDRATTLRLGLLGDLHEAVDNEEFDMVFQPQVDGRDGTVVAVEALMRWRHPDHGPIAPEVFIPLAENTGLINQMSRRGIESALTTLALLRAAGHRLSLSVNVSARQLSDLDLPRWISRAMLAVGVPPAKLTIEVTESTITADPQRAMQVLHELRGIGVRLSVDDFGTGYSSLSHLRRLQPDELKVDQSFVTQMCADENSAVIVRSTVDLGHALGLTVVAEGVEDRSTYDALTVLGCDRLQGFHIAGPMTGAALKAWLDTAAVHGGPVPGTPTPLVPAQPSSGRALPASAATG